MVNICGGDETVESLSLLGFRPADDLWAPIRGWVLSKMQWPRKKWKTFVIVDCCERRVPLATTAAHLSIAFGGYVSEWRFRCARGEGCTVNKNYLRTAHLRFYERG